MNDKSGATRTGDLSPEIIGQEVTKIYPGRTEMAVDHATFRIPAGQITVVLGPSGCGKTTLLKMINRLVEPTSGQIHIGGVKIHDLPATQLRRKIGYVIQQVGLFPHMTVAQNIAVVPHLEGWEKAAIQQRVSSLLEMIKLPAAYERRYPRHLSGGEQQRVGLARALAVNPGILLMDEPFGAIDSITRKNLQDELLQIQKQVGKTVLFVTHDVEEALKLGDQILIIHAGRLVQSGAPLEIISHPQNAFVAELVGSSNLLRRLSLMTAGDILAWKAQGKLSQPGEPQYHPSVGVHIQDDLRSVLTAMLEQGVDTVAVIDPSGQPVGSLEFTDLQAILA